MSWKWLYKNTIVLYVYSVSLSSISNIFFNPTYQGLFGAKEFSSFSILVWNCLALMQSFTYLESKDSISFQKLYNI